MTHQMMLQRSRKYRNGCPTAQAIELPIAHAVECEYGIDFSETENGFLLYPSNCLLIETIHYAIPSVTINVSGDLRVYSDIAHFWLRKTPGQAGHTKLYITALDGVPAALEAIRRSCQRKGVISLAVARS